MHRVEHTQKILKLQKQRETKQQEMNICWTGIFKG